MPIRQCILRWLPLGAQGADQTWTGLVGRLLPGCYSRATVGLSISRSSAWLLTILAATAYTVLIVVTPRGYHRPVAVLALGMAALCGWLLGPRVGLAAGAISALVAVTTVRALGAQNDLFLEGLPLYALAIGAGAGAGKLRQHLEEIRRGERAARAGEAAVFDALRQRDEFLAAASHDLQTPVSSIRLSTRRLRRDVRAGKAMEPDELVRELDYLEAAALRVQDVVADLLDVARLQMGQTLDLDRQSVDLVRIARRVAEDHLRGLEPHQVRIESADTEVVGYWDEARLERVLGNLVSNAVKYSPPEAEVLVSVGRGDDQASGRPVAVLRVQDHGIGIPQEDLPRVFEQFQRARNTGGRRGIGIGLAAARQIVQHHGGSITVESRENEGSTFEVRLPLD